MPSAKLVARANATAVCPEGNETASPPCAPNRLGGQPQEGRSLAVASFRVIATVPALTPLASARFPWLPTPRPPSPAPAGARGGGCGAGAARPPPLFLFPLPQLMHASVNGVEEPHSYGGGPGFPPGDPMCRAGGALRCQGTGGREHRQRDRGELAGLKWHGVQETYYCGYILAPSHTRRWRLPYA